MRINSTIDKNNTNDIRVAYQNYFIVVLIVRPVRAHTETQIHTNILFNVLFRCIRNMHEFRVVTPVSQIGAIHKV